LDEQAVLEEKMNDPATYEKPEEALKINSAYKEVSEWADSLMLKMGEIEEKIEEISGNVGDDL